MNPRTTFFQQYLLPLLICVSMAAAEAPRLTLLLDGQWDFQLDPNNGGETERWYGDGKKLADSITVPGAWDAQGFGAETER